VFKVDSLGYKWIAHYETKDLESREQWNIEVPGFGVPLGLITIEPTKDNLTDIYINFEIDTNLITKPPILQTAYAEALLDNFFSLLGFLTKHRIRLRMTEIHPKDETAKEYFENMKEPPKLNYPLYPPAKLTSAQFEKIDAEFKKIYGLRIGTVEDHTKWKVYYMMQNFLHWFGKSQNESQVADRILSLWIAFNILYNHVWMTSPNGRNPKDKDWKKIEYLTTSSRLLGPEVCREIIEDGSCRVLMSESGRAKEFGNCISKKQYEKALNEVLQEIRDTRNSIFHGSWIPEKSYKGISFTDANQPLEIATYLLERIVHEYAQRIWSV